MRAGYSGFIPDDVIVAIKRSLWNGAKQVEVARAIGVSQPTVSNIATGYRGGHIPWPDGSFGPFPQSRRAELARIFLMKGFEAIPPTQIEKNPETKAILEEALEWREREQQKEREEFEKVFYPPELSGTKEQPRPAEPSESTTTEPQGTPIDEMPYFAWNEVLVRYQNSKEIQKIQADNSNPDMTLIQRAVGILMKINPQADPNVVIPRNLPIILPELKKAIDKRMAGA